MPKAVKKRSKPPGTKPGQTETRFGERFSIRLQDDVIGLCNTVMGCLYVDDFSEFANDLLREGATKKLKDIMSLKPAGQPGKRL